MSDKEVKLNAAQRLILLEQESESTKDSLNYCQNQLMAYANEVDKISNVLMQLSRQVHAMVSLSETNRPISGKAIRAFLVDEEVQEMEKQVQNMIEQGALSVSESGVITDRSFIVGRQLDKDGNIINLRLQLATTSLNEENKKLFVDKKKGDIIQLESDNNSIEIVEVYQIAELKDREFEKEDVSNEPSPE